MNKIENYIKMSKEDFFSEIKNPGSQLIDVVKFKHDGIINILSYEYIAIKVKDKIQVGDNTYIFNKNDYVWIDIEKQQCYPFNPEGKIIDNKVYNIEKELEKITEKSSMSIIKQIRNKIFNTESKNNKYKN